MKRSKLIQDLINELGYKNYLEIGCYKGNTFFNIDAKKKIAVDPKFPIFFYKNALLSNLRNTKNLSNSYFQLKSSTFFKKKQGFIDKIGGLDLVFVDGLHTFRGSLLDVLNTLRVLNTDGLIIMHDCFPENAASAFPSPDFPTKEQISEIEGWTGAWSGDVWKTIVYLKKKYREELNVSVIDSDNGLGIIRQHDLKANFDVSIDEALFKKINKLTYQDLTKDSNGFLGLIPLKEASTHIHNLIDEISK